MPTLCQVPVDYLETHCWYSSTPGNSQTFIFHATLPLLVHHGVIITEETHLAFGFATHRRLKDFGGPSVAFCIPYCLCHLFFGCVSVKRCLLFPIGVYNQQSSESDGVTLGLILHSARPEREGKSVYVCKEKRDRQTGYPSLHNLCVDRTGNGNSPVFTAGEKAIS